MKMAFLRGLEKAPTFLVPIINPPFADNSPHLIHTFCPTIRVRNISFFKDDYRSTKLARCGKHPLGGAGAVQPLSFIAFALTWIVHE